MRRKGQHREDAAPTTPAPSILSSRLWVPAGLAAAAWAAYLTHVITSEQYALLFVFDRMVPFAVGKDWFLLLPGKLVALLAEWVEHALGLDKYVEASNILLDIAANLIIGFALCLASLALFTLFAAIAALFRPLKRSDTPLSGARAVGWRTLLATLLFVAAVYLVPFVLELFGEHMVHRRLGFIWAGVTLLALLLWMRSRPLVLPARPRIVSDGPAISKYASLQRLHDDYVKRYKGPEGSSVLLFDGVIERSRAIAGQLGGQQPNTRLGGAAQRFVTETTATLNLSNDEVAAVERFLLSVGRNDHLSGGADNERGVNAFFEEPFTDLHYRTIAEVAHIAQDEGGITLVICPETSVRSVTASLWQAFSPHCSDVTQTWWTPDNGDFDPKQVYSLLLVTDEGLQDRILGERANEFDRVLERLRLIVMIDAHRFDPSLLRLHLALLWTRTPAERVRVIAQGAPRREANNLYETLLGATGRHLEPFSLRSRGGSRMFTTVWNSSCAARDALLVQYKPEFSERKLERHGIEMVPLLLVPALRQHFKAAHFDPWEFKNRTSWQVLPQRLATVDANESTDFEAQLSKVPTLQQPTFGREPLVALIEDRFNLHDTLGQLNRAQLPPDLLVLTVSHNYPLRDFLADSDRLASVLSGNATLLFRPIAPIPHGGLRELALVVLMRMLTEPSIDGRQRGGVSRSEVTAYFSAIANRSLLRAFHASPTKRGIEALLHSQFRDEVFEIETVTMAQGGETKEPSLAVQTIPFDDERYVCRSHQRIAGTLGSFLPLVGRGVAPRQIGWLPRDDNGLAYAEGTAVLMQGKYYKVDEVENDRVVVESLADPHGHFPVEGGVAFRFWRLYGVPLDDQRVIVADEPDIGEHGNVRSIHATVFLPVERTTVGYHVLDTLAPLPGQSAVAQERPIVANGYIRRQHPSVNGTIIRYEVANDTAMAKDLARTAFTLAAVCNDVIDVLFPGLGHRIAVLSPQAGPVLERLRQTPEGRTAARRYPRLVAGVPQSEWHPPPPSDEVEASITRLLVSSFHEENAPPLASGGSRIDLIIVEDWPSDLGVARAIYQYRAHIERALAEFLTWLNMNQDRDSLYYRFGGSQLPDTFDFETAARVMRSVAGNRGHGQEP